MRRFTPRRPLPHSEYRAGTVFLSWRLGSIQPILADAERDIVLEVIRCGDGKLGDLTACVVMDDHVHALITLAPNTTARAVVQVWKSASSHRLTREHDRQAPVWQRGYFDRWILDPERIAACIGYIIQNPRRRWPDRPDYRWLVYSDPP